MANLIEQMEVLKGLTDEHLQAELTAPSGSAPPYLVATEVSRRKGMRQRYAAEQARREPQTTVLDDLTSAPTGGLPSAMNGAPAPSAMPPMGQMGAPPQVQSFASGGIVDAVNYNDISRRYTERLEGLGEDKDRARAMALIAASGAIMSGGHSNTLQNVGPGISAFATSYGDALKTIDSDELALLRGVTDIGQLQHGEELATLDRDFRERQLLSEERRATERLAFDRTPAAVQTEEWYNDPNTTQAERDSFDKHQFNPNAVNGTERLQDDFNRIVDNALKAVPEPRVVMPGEEAKVASDRLRQAYVIAYQQIRSVYGTAVAEQFRIQAGLAEGDVVMGGAAPAANGADPLDLGL